jgi:hypothetical protein
MVGRTGLVRICSMTPVCNAPRTDRASVLSSLGDPPWQTHLVCVCDHKAKKPRLKAYPKGGVRALFQCLDCGQKASNFIQVAGVTEHWDTELEERMRADYERARNQWEQKRISAYDSAAGSSSREWWAAYDRYLNTAVWAVKRELVFERCGGVCESCRQRSADQVHHLKYPDVFGLEPLWDLAAVCIPCHKIIHPHME